MQVLSSVGGIVAAIFKPFSIIVGYFASKMFEAKIIKKLFFMKRSRDEFL